MDPQTIGREVEKQAPAMARLVEEIGRVIIGQKAMIDRLMIGLLADGHLLVEGVPGLAKTTAVKTLARAIDTKFQRLQFTPDLLPADLIGTQVYSPKDSSFSVKKGPIFANLILADEINRAPAKVQSALLEAMQERQVTIGGETFPLPKPFLVMATQNPIEQEGTYPLPEAEVDRFLLKIRIDYPSREEEIQIMRRMGVGETAAVRPVLHPDDILKARATTETIFMDEKLYHYIADVVFATREPEKFGLADLKPLIQFGASPRASIYLTRAARAHAFLQGRGYVTPQDIKSIGLDVLRHRVLITYEAEAQDLTSETIVQRIFDKIDVP
ncbi:MAG TPA: AAA family ATPase [bacterium]|nr:AAA family ATPase [bacterium]